MPLLIYIIKMVFISGLLLGYYSLFLRNRTFHGFNRYFLLSVPALSLLLPLFSFELPPFWNQASAGSPVHLLGVGSGRFEEAATIYANSGSHSLFSSFLLAGIFSGFISIVLFIRFCNTIRFLQLLGRTKPSLQLAEAIVFFVSEKGTPFSFFRNIYWDEGISIDSAAGRQILRHEIFHVKNNHSLDILVIEFLTILCWFNPFFHIIRRELRAVHEYGADAYAAEGSDEFEYASLLLMKETSSSRLLTHPFFKNQIKRRITMITKIQQSRKRLLTRLMVLPLIAVLAGLFSFKLETRLPFTKEKTIRVVVDPGHGGSFPGVESNGVYEKNINLEISKKIQALSKEYNVEVIMTREKDEDMAGNDLKASLDYRTKLAAQKNADLFISIHTNAAGSDQQDTYSGFEIYVPDNENRFYMGSVRLASSITDYIRKDYPIAPELKQKPGQIQVLNKATIPAILIECGYIDNKSDLAYLQDEKNQEKIARDILEGIRKYGLQSTVNR
jgi:N-acetylmuramoyl-L-alanine amidase